MPAQIVPKTPGISVPRYSIVGKYTDEPESRFIQHVALVREEGPASHGSEVPVWHMQPPLVTGPISEGRTNQTAKCAAHVVGWLSLTSNERDGIEDWLAEMDKQARPASVRALLYQYTVALHPNDQWHSDENEVPLYRRFSCVTFVLSAYLEGAGINLIDMSNVDHVPEVDLETVVRAYGEAYRREGQRRTAVGLPGAGPWRIILAGYVFHAIDRPDESIRTVPYTVPSTAAASFPFAS